MVIKVVKEEVFDTKVTFIYDCDISTLAKYLVKIKAQLEDDLSDCSGCVIRNKEGRSRIVYFKDSDDLDTIVHELAHLCVRICEDKGVPICASLPNGYAGDETFAYLIGFYFRKILSWRR